MARRREACVQRVAREIEGGPGACVSPTRLAISPTTRPPALVAPGLGHTKTRFPKLRDPGSVSLGPQASSGRSRPASRAALAARMDLISAQFSIFWFHHARAPFLNPIARTTLSVRKRKLPGQRVPDAA